MAKSATRIAVPSFRSTENSSSVRLLTRRSGAFSSLAWRRSREPAAGRPRRESDFSECVVHACDFNRNGLYKFQRSRRGAANKRSRACGVCSSARSAARRTTQTAWCARTDQDRVQSSCLTTRPLWTDFTCSVPLAMETALSIASWLLALPVSHTTPFMSVST